MNLTQALLSVAVASVCLPIITQAEMYRCPAPDASFVFTDKLCIDGERRVGGSWVSVQEEAQRKREEEEAQASARRYAQDQQPQPTPSYIQSRSNSTNDEGVKKAAALFMYISGKCGHLSGSAEDRCVDGVRDELNEEGKGYFDYLNR
jgi:hypothetical protein